MHEVAPAVLYDQTPAHCLALCLVEEPELPAVIELPDQGCLGEDPLVGDRASRAVLAHAGPVDDQRARGHSLEQAVVLYRVGVVDVIHLDPGSQPAVHSAHGLEPGRAAVDHHEPLWSVFRRAAGHQVQADGEVGTAGAKQERFCVAGGPVTLLYKLVEGAARGDGVFGMSPEKAAALRQRGDLPTELGVRVDEVEHVPAGREEVDLVGSDQATKLQRV